MTKRQLALLERLEAWFEANGSASAFDAARDMNMPPAAAQAMVNLGVSSGRLVLVGHDVFTCTAFERVVADVREKLGDRVFQPRELRQALGRSRQWVDHFADSLGRAGRLERTAEGWRLKQSS